MKYKEFIANILESRPNEKQEGVYMECHHITPRCLGGNDDYENLVYLTAKEHYVAHKLLMLENPDNIKLAYAFSMMAFPKTETQQRGLMLTAEEYEEARKLFSEHSKGENNPMYGRSPYDGKTQEEILAINKKKSEGLKGKKKSPLHVQHVREAQRGKKMSEEAKRKMRENSRHLKTPGSTGMHWYTDGFTNVLCFEKDKPENFRKGKVISKEQADKCRESLEKAREHQIIGRFWFTNGTEDILAFECPEGFRRGRTNYGVNPYRDEKGRYCSKINNGENI